MMLDLEMSDLARRYSSEYVFFKILQISQENTCAGISFFTLFFMPSGLQLYYKETPTQMFFCEIYEIFDQPKKVKNLNDLFFLPQTIFDVKFEKK